MPEGGPLKKRQAEPVPPEEKLKDKLLHNHSALRGMLRDQMQWDKPSEALLKILEEHSQGIELKNTTVHPAGDKKKRSIGVLPESRLCASSGC